MPLEFAEGAISFNPQPTARNLNKPARMLRLGLKGRRKLYRNKNPIDRLPPNPMADAHRQRSAALWAKTQY